MTYKEMREMSRMTQQAFSEFFGIPKRTIENWDSEKSICKQYLIDLCAYRLSHNMETLFERSYFNIKDLRNATGMSIKEFSEFLNLSNRTVENWETRASCADYLIGLIEFKLLNERFIK